MKTKLLTTLAFAIALTCSIQAAEANWLTDYPAAVKQAAAEKKPLLLDFTGSDWCGWCIKLDKEVFSQKAFIDYAAENLVLVKLDFPANKPQSPAERKQNEALMKQHGVQGFPTIIVLDSNEKKLGQLGYQPGGPEKWIKALEKITRPTR